MLQVLEGLRFMVAAGQDRERAVEMTRQVYLDEFGQDTDDGFDAGAHFLIACIESGEIAATSRVVGPEQRPFEIEAFVNLSEFLSPDRVPALVGRLTVRRDLRTVNRHTFIQIGMLKLAYVFAQKQGITDFVLFTFPHLLAFYRGALFEPRQAFEHPEWGPVHVMHLDLLGLEARCATSRRSLARLLFATDLPNLVV